MTDQNKPNEQTKQLNFIKERINEDIKSGKIQDTIVTRFPPEPNGYLHIGHAKSICLNFGLAIQYGGRCHLRFDDTNPEKEDDEYIQSIKKDVNWLGFDWGKHLYFASDYFDQLYEYAVELIKKGKAYVDHLTQEEIRSFRGTLKEPGKNSPYRERSIEENLELFEKMRNGEFKDGECVLRAKIDMSSGNICMRDSIIYRIKKVSHHRTGNKWCIYPMYDFTHCLSDSIEGITHSICTLEFENNRELYDWILNELQTPNHPRQIEFARLNLTYTVMSKRKLLELVQNKLVTGWDDPRMPTISGLKRRGYTPSSIRDFCERIGLAKRDSLVDIALLEHCLREELNKTALRRMAVLRPIKLIIDNYSDDKTEELEAINNPEDESMGHRTLPFSKELFIEETDFMEDAPKKYFRLAPGKEVRLKHAYYVTCTDYIKDEKTGKVLEVHCTYDPNTKGGWSDDGRKVKGTIHWLSAKHAHKAEVRLYEHLFTKDDMGSLEDGKDYRDYINPDSLTIIQNCHVEPSLVEAVPDTKYQFERTGYFSLDEVDSSGAMPVFNRAVSLKDSWSKIDKKI